MIQPQDLETGSPKPVRLGGYLRRYPALWIGAISINVLVVGFMLGLPFLESRVIEQVRLGTLTAPGLFKIIALYLVLGLFEAALSIPMRRCPLYLGQGVVRDIRRDVFTHLQQLSDDYYIGERTGDIMTRMSSDLTAVGEMIGYGLINGIRTTVALTFAFIIMFNLNTPLAVVVVCMFPILSLTSFILLRLVRRRYEHSQEQFSALSSFFQENFGGIRLIKGSGIEDRQEQRFGSHNREYVRRNLFLAKIESPLWPCLIGMFSLGNGLILWLGGSQIIRGEMEIEVLWQFIRYMGILAWPVLALGWAMNLWFRGMASWKRVSAILQAPVTIHDTEATRRDLTTVTGDIEFRHVSVAIKGQPVLQDISFTIPEGMTIGLTGPTGSGKTILAGLLTRRMDPTNGQVFIGLHDLRDIPLEVLRKTVRCAPQEPFLFSESLENNVYHGMETPDRDKLLWASEVSQLRSEVEQFAEGFQTVLGERGVTLSGGQRQRTALARTVAGNPDILILDDTLSAVDTQTESAILNGLHSVLRERTGILISHRVSTLRNTDFIVVLQDGRISQMGSHEELLKQDGYYREQHELQQLEARLESL